MNTSTHTRKSSSFSSPTISVAPSKVQAHRINSTFINYDNQKDVLFIKGKSNHHQATSFHDPIEEMIDTHYLTKKALHVFLYINTSTNSNIKYLFRIFKKLTLKKSTGKNIEITWFCNLTDQGALKNAKDFNDLFDLKISIIPV